MEYKLETSPVDGNVHRQNLQLLYAGANATTQAAFRALSGGVSEIFDYYAFAAGGPTLPRRTYTRGILSTDPALVILNGMENFDKVPAILSGWTDRTGSGNTLMKPFLPAASTIYAELMALSWVTPASPVIVIGHSYGGSAGFYAAALFATNGYPDRITCYTYGAPKESYSRAAINPAPRRMRRVWLNGDPAATLPPTSDHMSGLWTLAGVPTARLWSEWWHPISGYQLGAGTGELKPDTDQAITSWPGVITSLVSWLGSSLAFGSDLHSLSAYQNNFAGVPAVTEPSAAPVAQPVSRLRLAGAGQVALQRDEGLAVAAQVAEANPQDVAAGIQVGVPLIPGVRYRGGMYAGFPAVFYDGTVVQVTRTRRLRRALVRFLNKSL